MASSSGGISDKVRVWHTRKDETGKEISRTEITAPSEQEKVHFCPHCGEPLTEVAVFICDKGCFQRYVQDFDEETGHLILAELGKDEELKKQMEAQKASAEKQPKEPATV